MYSEQLEMLLAVLERAALLLMALFLLTQTRRVQTVFRKEKRPLSEQIAIAALFTFFAVFSTYTGIPVDGSLVNVRITAVMSAGLLFGPIAGLSAGIISGLHRYLIDIYGPTSVPCLISSMTAGVVSTWLYFRCRREHLWFWGSLCGMLCEVLTMTLIVVLAKDRAQGWEIVHSIALPMILGSVCIGLIVRMVQNLDDEKERMAGRQAKLALQIASRTLPHFRESSRESLRAICNIIRESIGADAVAITDRENVLAYVGYAETDYWKSYHGMSSITHQAVDSGRIIISNDIDYADFHSLMIIPLHENEKVSGALKIYYCDQDKITDSLREIAIGLSQVISTQLEVSRVDKLRQMAEKAEFSALQSKINPHFLFNALNAISTLIRLRPDEARQLISNLADFMRYNLRIGDEKIDIQEEIGQVRDYVAIEKARFGAKLTVTFDVDDVHTKVPGLLLQPLVENAIIHGIQPLRGPGKVDISVKQQADGILVTIRDTGIGISESVLEKFYDEDAPKNHIGLVNVHQRLKLLGGKGLQLRRCDPGTEVSFVLPNEE